MLKGIDDLVVYGRFHAAMRAAAAADTCDDPLETMLARAAAVFQKGDSGNVVANVLEYTTEGADLVVSWSTLAGDVFESRVRRGCLVRELAHAVHAARFGYTNRRVEVDGFDRSFKALLDTRTPSKALEPAQVAIIGPRGTNLDWDHQLPQALDYEADKPTEDEDGEFYPLHVLIGDAWRELGLEAATRWRCLREHEFVKLFGMSKASFEQLPSWKQLPLKKSSGLF